MARRVGREGGVEGLAVKVGREGWPGGWPGGLAGRVGREGWPGGFDDRAKSTFKKLSRATPGTSFSLIYKA